MPDLEHDLIVASMLEALETMGFISAMPPEDASQPPAEAMLVHMEFTGAVVGSLELVAPLELGRRLASNMLGGMPDDPEVRDHAADCLQEAANVICGVLLWRLAGDKSDLVSMGLPRSQAFEGASAWTEFCARPSTRVLDAEGVLVAVCLQGQL